jgi:hypothetical protein
MLSSRHANKRRWRNIYVHSCPRWLGTEFRRVDQPGFDHIWMQRVHFVVLGSATSLYDESVRVTKAEMYRDVTPEEIP